MLGICLKDSFGGKKKQKKTKKNPQCCRDLGASAIVLLWNLELSIHLFMALKRFLRSIYFPRVQLIKLALKNSACSYLFAINIYGWM